MATRALVVGGGLSGLGAALFLSRLGRAVTLVEKAPQLGALARGFQRGGLSFETGFHYAGGLGEGGALRRYLERLGLFRQGLEVCPLADPGGERLRFPESEVDCPLPRAFAEFRRLLPKSSEIDGFFRQGQEIFQRSPFLNPEAGDFDPQRLYHQGPSLAAALEALPLDQRLKTLLGFRCLLYGARPSEASLAQFALVNEPYLHGAHRVVGGGAALIRAFEAALADAKVEVITGRTVKTIKTDGCNTAVGVICEDRRGRSTEIACDLCVYTGSPAALPGLLPEGSLRPVLRRRLVGLRYTPSPLLLFGRSRSPWLEHRNFFLCPENLEDWFDPARRAFYASGGAGHDGYYPFSAVALAAEEAQSFGGRTPAYRAWKARATEEFRASLSRHCPELGAVEIVAAASSLTLGDYSRSFGPGIYGALHSAGEAPILPVTRVGRLALAGQSIVMPGLLGVLVSSALAVGSLVGFREILEVLR